MTRLPIFQLVWLSSFDVKAIRCSALHSIFFWSFILFVPAERSRAGRCRDEAGETRGMEGELDGSNSGLQVGIQAAGQERELQSPSPLPSSTSLHSHSLLTRPDSIAQNPFVALWHCSRLTIKDSGPVGQLTTGRREDASLPRVCGAVASQQRGERVSYSFDYLCLAVCDPLVNCLVFLEGTAVQLKQKWRN